MTAIPFQGVRLRTVALPTEHGGWSFCLEPILLGLLLSPSAGGAAIGGASLALFLARHPFKLAAFDRKRGKSYPRTVASLWFAAIYATVALLSLAVAWKLGGTTVFLPLAIALPLAAVQFLHDIRNESRALPAEMAGGAAAGAIAASIVIAGGWNTSAALALWALLVARTVPTVLYVRARVRVERGMTIVSPLVSNALHVAAVAAGVWLAWSGRTPWLAVAALVVLMVRAAAGLSPLRRPARAATIGIAEVIFGITAMLLIAGGYLASI
jgi:hypothetical protein